MNISDFRSKKSLDGFNYRLANVATELNLPDRYQGSGRGNVVILNGKVIDLIYYESDDMEDAKRLVAYEAREDIILIPCHFSSGMVLIDEDVYNQKVRSE